MNCGLLTNIYFFLNHARTGAVTLLTVPQKKSQPSVVELLLGAALLPAQLRPREARAKQPSAVVDHERCGLTPRQGRVGQAEAQGSVDHRPVPTVEDQSEHGVVTDEVLGLLGQAWALRCDGTSDEQEYTEDISNVISEIPPVSQTSSTAAAPAQASQAQSVPPPDPPAAVASRADRRKSSAMAKAAKDPRTSGTPSSEAREANR